MRTHLTIPFVFALAFLTVAIPAAASDAQVGNGADFQEFDAPSSVAVGARDTADTTSVPNGAGAARPSAQDAAAPQHVTPPPATPLGSASLLKSILSFLTPTKEDLQKTMDSIVAPKDEPNARPGPHWQTAARRGRGQ